MLDSHNGIDFRSCTKVGAPYEWLHPGRDAIGRMPEGKNWFQVSCWLNEDVRNQLPNNPEARTKFHFLAGEITEYLDDAAHGRLCQKHPDSVVDVLPDVERTWTNRNVFEMRLAAPYPIGEARLKVRVYFAEPRIFEGLVSLGGQLKNVDDQNWEETQNQFIAQCGERGKDWAAKY